MYGVKELSVFVVTLFAPGRIMLLKGAKGGKLMFLGNNNYWILFIILILVLTDNGCGCNNNNNGCGCGCGN